MLCYWSGPVHLAGIAINLRIDELILDEKSDADIAFAHETSGIYMCQFIVHVSAITRNR